MKKFGDSTWRVLDTQCLLLCPYLEHRSSFHAMPRVSSSELTLGYRTVGAGAGKFWSAPLSPHP